MNSILKTNNKVFLYIGILLYIIGTFALNYFDNNIPQTVSFQQPLFKVLHAFPAWLVYAILFILASVFEEFAFRGWIIKKKFWKYLSLTLVLTYLHLVFDSLLLTAFVFPILFVIYFILKNEKLRLVLLIIFTSILFGIMHYPNYESWSKLFAIFTLIGLSFILCYVGLRFGFIYTILGHFINNFIALMFLTVFAHTNYVGKFENTSYSAEINKTSTFDLTDQTHWIFPDSISTNGYITEIASVLPPFKNNIIYNYSIEELNKYSLLVTNKSEKEINREQLFNDYISHTGLILDTLYRQSYVLNVYDTTKLINHLSSSERSQKTNIQSLVISIRDIYHLPLILEDDYINYRFNFDWKLFRIKSSDELILRLNKEYGILITKDSEEKATIITIRE